MKITANLQHGSIDAEFVAEDRDELERDLLGFATFLADNSELFGQLDVSGNGGSSANGQGNGETADQGGDVDTDDHPLSSLARKVGVPVAELDEIVYVDPNGEEMPQLLVDKNQLGDNKTARQRFAAFVILRVWEDCYGNERMKTSQLMTILSLSDISDVDLFNAWAGPGKGNFDSSGSGASATVGLTGPGKREALKRMKRLVEKRTE